MEREYEVIGDGGYRPPGTREVLPQGERFKTEAPLAHEAGLVSGGHIRVVGSAKLACPACGEQDDTKTKARTPKFGTYAELQAHYASDHAGLEVPAEQANLPGEGA